MSADDNFVKVIIVYDPLNVDNRKTVELEYQPGKPLSHYLGGLPEDVDWGVALNGAHVPKAGLALTFPKKHDTVIVAPIPHGGDDKGGIFAIVATLALSVFAPWAAGALGFVKGTVGFALVSAGISIAGGLLINAFLPKPDTGSPGQGQQTFGIDGPKNTSTAGVPVPLLYGKHGFGGNLLDLYTENTTDTDGKSVQFLYGRVAVSEGPIKSISDLRFNDQPVENFEDVEIDYRLGSGNQTVSEWFDETITLYNQARDLTTDWQYYDTVGEVDKMRIDVAFPAGLYFMNSEGNPRNQSVTLETQYRKVGSSTWLPFAANTTWTKIANNGATTEDRFRVTFTYHPDIFVSVFGESGQHSFRRNNSPDPDFELQYRVNGGSWQTHKTYSAPDVTNNVDGTQISEIIEGFNNDGVEFRLIDNAAPVGSQGSATLTIDKVEAKTAVNQVTVEENSTAAVRRSFKTDKLEQGEYQVRIRRTTEEQTEKTRVQDKVTLTDFGEIVLDPVALNYTAWVGYKIKMSGQLNSVPKFTGVAEGRVMSIFDQEGNITQTAFSRNPADVVIDAYTHPRFGGKMEYERIDFSAFAEWRQFCIDNDLTFDGNFTDFSNIDEAIKHAYIAGRAQRIAVGARVSVAIDGPAEPVMVFNSSLIERGSLEISYLPFSERINDISVSYFDEDDLYQQRTVRAVNDTAIARGEPLKSASISLKGITQRTRAQREANFRMNYNRLVTRQANWMAPMHALHCTVGDVVLLQTEMVEWNEGGMLKSGSSSTHLKLDRPVTFENGVSYSVMVHRDTRKIADVYISNQTSSVVTVDQVLANDGSARRLKMGTEDYAILRVMPGATTTDLLIEKGVTGLVGANAEIWSTDLLDEVGVINPGAGEYDTLDLSTPLTDGAPPAYCAFIFGEMTTLKKPFRITKIKKEEETKAKIDAVEYVADIYNDSDNNSGTLMPAPVTGTHVGNLSVIENTRVLEGGARQPVILVTWENPDNGQHIASLVQYSINDGNFTDFETTADESVAIPAATGDVVRVRVIARTPDGFLPVGNAPVVTHTVEGYTDSRAAPLGWVATPGPRSITFKEPDGVDRQNPPYDTQLMFGDSTFGSFQIWQANFEDVFANATKVADFSADSFTLNLPINSGTKSYWITVTDSAGNVSPASTRIDAAPETQRNITLATNAQVFTYEENGQSPTPSGATLTATASNTAQGATIYYEFFINGVSQVNSIASTFSYTPQTAHDDMPDRIEVILRENGASGDILSRDEITMLGVKRNSSAIVAVASNEAHAIPTESDGSSPDMSGSGTRISAYYGATALTYDGSGASDMTFAVSSSVISGTVTPGSVSLNAGDALVGAHSGMTTDVAVIRYTVTGTVDGNNFTRQIDQTLSKAKAGAAGADGGDGLSTVVRTVYRRQSTKPSPPISGSYDFGTQTLTPPLGWHAEPPGPDGDPLWGSTASAWVTGTTGTDGFSSRWSDVFKVVEDGQDGAPGDDGVSVFRATIHRRATSQPSTPSGGSYDFGADTLTPPSGWSDGVPSGTAPIWVTRAGVSTQGTTGVETFGTWDTPALLAENGQDGADGVAGDNTAIVQLVQKNASNTTPPADPLGTFTYTFATGVLSGGTLNGWSQSVPNVEKGEFLWVIQATAVSKTATDTIDATEFSGAVVVSGTGLDGISSAPILLYNKASSDTPPSDPSGTYTYTFSTKTLDASGVTTNGWQEDAYDISDGERLFMISATASSATDTDDIPSSEFSAPKIIARSVKGDTGNTGDTVITGRVYYQTLQATAPSTPSATSFDKATGTFSGLTAGWATTQPSVELTDTSVQEWSSGFTVTIDGVASNQTLEFESPTGAIQVTADIESDNFVAGSAGFRINRLNGEAEFGPTTIRGKLSPDQLELDGTTLEGDGDGNLVVKTGGVNTLQLAANAATIPISAVRSGSVGAAGGNITAATPAASGTYGDTTFTREGGGLRIEFNFQMFFLNLSSTATVTFKILRDTTVLRSTTFDTGGISPGGFVSYVAGESGRTGTYTYKLEVEYEGSSFDGEIGIRNVSTFALETKR